MVLLIAINATIIIITVRPRPLHRLVIIAVLCQPQIMASIDFSILKMVVWSQEYTPPQGPPLLCLEVGQHLHRR